jgi:4-diphosphocytidyl-2-C-methyl-D-erythritol kinase
LILAHVDIGTPCETAYAKINLALHVRGRRSDGYHTLETLFAFAEDGDELTVVPSHSLNLTIDGRFGAGLSNDGNNLVLKAARALQAAFKVQAGAALHLDKRLPIAAGIGGGSADAAAAIRLLVRHWGIETSPAQLHAIAAPLGADVPACLLSQTCFGTGVGDALEPAPDPAVAGAPILLVNPLAACPTGPVFAAWDGHDRGPLERATWREGRNDLEQPAVKLVPEISETLAVMKGTDANLVRMSGSGATCFALFDDSPLRDEAADIIRRAHPNWWTCATVLRP